MYWILFFFFFSILLRITEGTENSKPKLHSPPYPLKPKRILYHYDSKVLDLLKDDKQALVNIEKLIKDFGSNTCLLFKRKKSKKLKHIGINFFLSGNTTNNVKLYKSKSKPTTIYLTSEVYKDIFKFRFYFGLAFGLIPEIQRIDTRLDVKINWQNIKPEYISSYKTSNYFYPYLFFTDFDVMSAMMFPNDYGSKDGKSTFNYVDGAELEKLVKESFYFTYNDYKKINYIYCNNKCKKYRDCENEGYYYDDKCGKCTCPEMFEGDKCEKIKASPSCNNSNINNIIATSTEEELTLKNNGGDCYIYLKASEEKNSILIETKELYNLENGTELNRIEVRWKNDKGVKGSISESHNFEPNLLVTFSNDAVIKWTSKNKKGSILKLFYKGQ